MWKTSTSKKNPQTRKIKLCEKLLQSHIQYQPDPNYKRKDPPKPLLPLTLIFLSQIKEYKKEI